MARGSARREFECGSCGVVFTLEGEAPKHAPGCEYADTVEVMDEGR